MATDTYQAAFAAFAAHNGLEPNSPIPVKFSIADLEHAFYMGMARGTTQGTAQASDTIISLARHNKQLSARISELEGFGIKGDSDLIKSLLARLAKYEDKPFTDGTRP